MSILDLGVQVQIPETVVSLVCTDQDSLHHQPAANPPMTKSASTDCEFDAAAARIVVDDVEPAENEIENDPPTLGGWGAQGNSWPRALCTT